MNKLILLLFTLALLLASALHIPTYAHPDHQQAPPPTPTRTAHQQWAQNLYATMTAGFQKPEPTVSLPTPTNTRVPPTATPTAAAPTTATRSNDPVRIVIEPLGIDTPLIPVGLDANQVPIVPRHDVGWYHYSAAPGQGDNIVLWGHVLRFRDAPNRPAPFANLRDAPLGTPITLYTGGHQPYHYAITSKQWVTPDQVAYILPQGKEMLTLVSCIGDQVIVNGSVEDMSHRLITIAEPIP
jgi:sortase (surface protein transpeptidase)